MSQSWESWDFLDIALRFYRHVESNLDLPSIPDFW